MHLGSDGRVAFVELEDAQVHFVGALEFLVAQSRELARVQSDLVVAQTVVPLKCTWKERRTGKKEILGKPVRLLSSASVEEAMPRHHGGCSICKQSRRPGAAPANPIVVGEMPARGKTGLAQPKLRQACGALRARR